ncbi:hypothetical protein MPNT_160054 [Candidatus Methylacidithermus pantelleriae]|uniref:Uncharacterized protein n=1 Tax=Candidatus Methylacidithermus pantelleriae TaxID=2744239 RepID=A0A8J2BNP3_9BACT|nr:hypothetical protein MPNT_160054 [Candidatus Methylacidithermus pantelleriae]
MHGWVPIGEDLGSWRVGALGDLGAALRKLRLNLVPSQRPKRANWFGTDGRRNSSWRSIGHWLRIEWVTGYREDAINQFHQEVGCASEEWVVTARRSTCATGSWSTEICDS